VNELERRLVALGGELELPAEPDLAAAVTARLGERPHRAFPWRAAALVAAVLVVAIAAAFAVPQARTTILRWFHLRGVTVERVETLPRAVERAQAGGLGQPYSRAEAERLVGFGLALPPFSGGRPPSRVFVLDAQLATVVVRAHGRTVLLSEFRSSDFDFLKKATTTETRVEPVQVGGEPGLWVGGGTHVVVYPGGVEPPATLIHGNVLLWLHGNLTLRLEGKLTKSQALGLARTIR
jgi:hypothetical protein